MDGSTSVPPSTVAILDQLHSDASTCEPRSHTRRGGVAGNGKHTGLRLVEGDCGCCCPMHHPSLKMAVLVQGSREKSLDPSNRCLVLGAQISRLRSTRSRASLIAPQGLLQRTFWTGGPFIAFMTMQARMRENELSMVASAGLLRVTQRAPPFATRASSVDASFTSRSH